MGEGECWIKPTFFLVKWLIFESLLFSTTSTSTLDTWKNMFYINISKSDLKYWKIYWCYSAKYSYYRMCFISPHKPTLSNWMKWTLIYKCCLDVWGQLCLPFRCMAIPMWSFHDFPELIPLLTQAVKLVAPIGRDKTIEEEDDGSKPGSSNMCACCPTFAACNSERPDQSLCRNHWKGR